MSVYHVFAYFFILAGGKIILAGRWENDFGRAVDKIILVGGKIILEGGKIINNEKNNKMIFIIVTYDANDGDDANYVDHKVYDDCVVSQPW